MDQFHLLFMNNFISLGADDPVGRSLLRRGHWDAFWDLGGQGDLLDHTDQESASGYTLSCPAFRWWIVSLDNCTGGTGEQVDLNWPLV